MDSPVVREFRESDANAVYNLYLDENKMADAEKYTRSALKWNPAYKEAWSNLSLISLEKKQWGKAVEYAEKALEIDGEYETAGFNKGLALLKSGKVTEGVAILKEIAKKAPSGDELGLKAYAVIHELHERIQESGGVNDDEK